MALDIRERRKPPGHWKTAKTQSILGAALTGLERFEEAERLLLDSQPRIEMDRGNRHRRNREAIQRIINLYEAWGKPVKAAEWRDQLAGVIANVGSHGTAHTHKIGKPGDK